MKPYTLLMSQMPLRPEDYPPGFAAYVQPLLDARQRVLQRLSDEERAICHQILEMFLHYGHGPTIDELVSTAPFSAEKVTGCVERLNSIDFLKYDAGSRQVVVLYPFSAPPGPNRVHIPGKPQLYGMWPGGAIAIPIVYGVGTEATITSPCGFCQRTIEFELTVTMDGAVSRSTTAVALREWDPLATSEDRAVPHFIDRYWQRVQFFCHEEHYTQWKAGRPSEQGFLLTFAQSARICRAFYGDFRGQMAETPTCSPSP